MGNWLSLQGSWTLPQREFSFFGGLEVKLLLSQVRKWNHFHISVLDPKSPRCYRQGIQKSTQWIWSNLYETALWYSIWDIPTFSTEGWQWWIGIPVFWKQTISLAYMVHPCTHNTHFPIQFNSKHFHLCPQGNSVDQTRRACLGEECQPECFCGRTFTYFFTKLVNAFPLHHQPLSALDQFICGQNT